MYKFWLVINKLSTSLMSYSAKKMFGSSDSVPNVDFGYLTEEEKNHVCNSSLEAAGKVLLFTFNGLKLNDKLDGMFKVDGSKDEFLLLFKKVTPTNIKIITEIAFTK